MSEDLLVAILPNGVRGFISLACSDADLESFVAHTRGMGAMAYCRVADTADFCEEREERETIEQTAIRIAQERENEWWDARVAKAKTRADFCEEAL